MERPTPPRPRPPGTQRSGLVQVLGFVVLRGAAAQAAPRGRVAPSQARGWGAAGSTELPVGTTVGRAA